MSEDSIIDMLLGPGDPFGADCNCPASSVVAIRVCGEIDLLTERRFEQHLRFHLCPQTGAVKITVDLTAVTFISAGGMSILAEAADHALRLGVEFAVVGASPWTSRILAMWRTLCPLAARPNCERDKWACRDR